MDTERIRREVDRLAPWYYKFDLGGVHTDDWPACDDHGHRVVSFPEVREGFWRGKRVLDVGCNEGAWSFGVVGFGAAEVDAFDCREVNIEKARFVAALRGVTNIDFQVGSADEWFKSHDPYDFIIFPGVLYHLPRPWDTVREYCDNAREGILVATALWGGEEIGYTRYEELDNIAASENSLDSMMPNNVFTVIAEFARHGFHPSHIYETRLNQLDGGTTMLMKNCRPWSGFVPVDRPLVPAEFDVHLLPDDVEEPGDRRHPFDLQAAIYNVQPRPRAVNARLQLFDADGGVAFEIATGPIDFPPRVKEKGDEMSISHHFCVELDLPAERCAAELTLTDPGSGRVVTTAQATLAVRG